jgi:cell pole-organizing protein PopZ
MAQQLSSAQREPSMEEILASIRRIIEDGDPVRSGIGAASQSEAPAASETIEDETVESAIPEPANIRGQLRPSIDAEPRVVAPAPAAATREEPVRRSLEEVRSAALSRISRPAPDPWKPEHARQETPPLPEGTSEAKPDLPETQASEPVGIAAVPSPADTTAESESVKQMEAAPAPSPVQPAPSAALKPATVPDDAGDGRKTAILSESTGRQVAAAFGELNEAFEASRRRSFDEIAEELMRPMLQDWLDNNLPRLVEKLVREEIERVARGGMS